MWASLPSVHLDGLVHIDGGLKVLSRTGQDLNLRGETLRRTVGVLLHDKLIQVNGYGHIHHPTLLVVCPSFGLANGRNHPQPLHVGIAQRGGGHGDEKAEVVKGLWTLCLKNYNQTLKELKSHFSERRTMALVCKLEKCRMQLVHVMHKVIEQTDEYQKKVQKSGEMILKCDYLLNIWTLCAFFQRK